MRKILVIIFSTSFIVILLVLFLRFSLPNNNIMIVEVFFGDEKENSNAIDCEKVFPVVRMIPKTEAIGRAALEQLLLGPTEAEDSQSYYTSINKGVKINYLKIENGKAFVDFDEKLEEGVGGSCRVTAIASQIKETLKQFPTVDSVVISVNGRVDDVLQP